MNRDLNIENVAAPPVSQPTNMIIMVDEARAVGRRYGPAKLLAYGACFLAGFLLISFASRKCLPRLTRTSAVRIKFEQFVKRKDDFDTLFVGSSRVYRHLIPTRFDAVSAELGTECHSFNLGVPAMFGIESEHFLRQILAERPAHVRLVIVEANHLGKRINEANLRHPDIVAWHDWNGTVESIRLVWAKASSKGECVRRTAHHLEMGALHLVNAGGGCRLIADCVTRDKSALDKRIAEIMGDRGFAALDDEILPGHSQYASTKEQHEQFLADIPGYLAEVAEFAKDPDRVPEEACQADLDYLARLKTLVETHGARLVIFIPPVQDRRQHFAISAQRQGKVETLINYANPSKYPVYFEPRLRFNRGHLLREGAEQLTSQLAHDVWRP